jgi:ADP-ribose pyrophosphatase YjhB (NUDIX family)
MASKQIRKYKCPFCNDRYTREDLVSHIDEKHHYDIPENFTPFRYVFNYVNKKPLSYHGKCTECGGPTDWDENKGRYNRQCNKQACHDSYVKKFEDNMMKTRGVTRISATEEGLEKMLANRKISGEYTFKNGKKKKYVGSYELKALEFMDKVLNMNPDDILSPGPILEYSYNGNTHIYITDFYYQPYNLVIEVKDGGNNPNKRNMAEYRAKQIAKEKYIIKHTNYNYLRLTNNDMSQLIAVFTNLKMQMVENTGERVIHVNEELELNAELALNEEVVADSKISPDDIGSVYFVYGKNKVANACVKIKGFKTPFRAKSTLIPIKNINGDIHVFCKLNDEGNINIFPGGGWNPNEDPEDAAARETQEEAKLNIKDIKYCGELYQYSDNIAKCVKENIPEDQWWGGYYSKIYVGVFKSKYTGKIDAVDRNPWMLSGKWEKYDDIKDSIHESYRKAIDKYIRYYMKKTINEMMSCINTFPVVGLKDSDAYITMNLQNNVFSDNIAVTDGKMNSVFTINDDGIFEKLSLDDSKKIKECSIFYRIGTKEDISEKIKPLLGQSITNEALYETLTGIKLYDYDQINFNLESTDISIYEKLDIEALESYILGRENLDTILESIDEVKKYGRI